MPTIAEALNVALRYHQAGQLPEAESIYRQILQADPHCAQAHSNLGIALQSQGRLAEAEDHCRHAVRLLPQSAEAHNNLGNALGARGRHGEAVVHFREALRLNPQFALAHNHLAGTLHMQGQLDEAVAGYRRALQCWPDYAEAHGNLAAALQTQGKLAAAEVHFREAQRLRPHSAEALNNLGGVLQAQGKLEEAVTCFQNALRLDPAMTPARFNLGVALSRQQRLEEAAASFRQVLQVQPDHAQACYELGLVLVSQGAIMDAIASFQESSRLDPHDAEAAAALAVMLSDQAGLVEEALAVAERGLRHRANDKLRIIWATRLPIIYQSQAELVHWRNRLLQEIRRLRELHVVRDVTTNEALNLFFPPYQGFNDRDLQREVARLHRAPAAAGGQRATPPRHEAVSLAAPAGLAAAMPPQTRIRIGLISSFFRNHTIGHLNRGLIAQLSRDAFSVTVLSVCGQRDETADLIRAHADYYVDVPRNLPAARQLIAEQNLDVLLYTDIGMVPITYTLAFSRLAPVQCVTWGHPVTTGIDTVDYFISAEALETAESDQHYTERLVRLKTLPVYYYRPPFPAALRDRAHFGLPAAGTLYACPQTLFKFHPDFDEVLGGILRDDPHATLMLIKSRFPHWEELLRRRFAATLPDVLDRICFVPSQGRDGYLNLLAISDVLLDPLHFGGGNTSYEGLAAGIPIVTLPSAFLRGRITYALYKQLNVLDCVAENPQDYIRRALRLGTDPGYREMMHNKILAASGVLYENPDGIREIERFFQRAVLDHSERRTVDRVLEKK